MPDSGAADQRRTHAECDQQPAPPCHQETVPVHAPRGNASKNLHYTDGVPKRIDEDELFRAAVTVFAESGYRATTTQEIAKRAGVNEVTLFRRYGDKASLINAALTRVLADTSFARVETTDDVRADLIALVRAYAQTVQTYGGAVMTLLTEASRHPELREAMAALMPNLLNAARLVEAHQDSGHLAEGDPMQKVVMLIAPQLVSSLWARAGAEVPGPEFDPDAVVAAFLNGHRAG